MEFTGERYFPNMDNYSENYMQHIQRYIAAVKLCSNKVVLDIACGEGYGSDMLANNAVKVYGIDISEEAVENAKKTYKKDNLEFIQGSVEKIPLEDNSVDVIVSFETIEHVDEIMQHNFLKEIKRVLKEDGLLIMSSPDKKYYSDIPKYKNEFHIKELYEDEFNHILKYYFKNVELYFQGMMAVSYITNDKNIHIKQIEKFESVKNFEGFNAEIIIAVCSDNNIPNLDNSFVEDYNNKYYAQKHLLISMQKAVGDPSIIIEQKENYICEQRDKIQHLDDDNRELNGIIIQKENYICEQRDKIQHLDDDNRELNGIIIQKENYICEQRGILEQQDKYIIEKHEKIDELENHIKTLEKELSYRNKFLSVFPFNILFKIYKKLGKKHED